MGDYAVQARDMGINYIGSCCGSVAIHVREMARALGKLPEDGRIWKKGGEKPMSAYEYYGHDVVAGENVEGEFSGFRDEKNGPATRLAPVFFG